MKVRRISITRQILIILVLALVVSNIVLCVVSVRNAGEDVREAIQQRMLDIANCAAANVDGDALGRLNAESEGTEDFQSVYDALAVFRDNASLKYIYGIRDLGNSRYVFVIDPDVDDPAGYGEEIERTDALAMASRGTAAVDEDSHTDEWGVFYSSYSPVYDSNGRISGIIGVDFDASWYEEQIFSHMRTVIIISIVALLAGVALILLIIVRIRKSFNMLNSMLESLSDGSGDLTRKLDITSGDEFEVIAGNMNKFISQVCSIVGSVKGNVAEFSGTSEELATVVDKAAATMDNLSVAVEETARCASVEAREVEGSSEDVKVIVEKLSEMTDMTNKAESFSDDMSKSATDVSECFEGLIAAIKESMKQLMDVTKEIESVGTSVDSVIEAANIIDSIANQTNLLALNASIEAARAGEAGRGFAVVAEEIGNLAAESNSSASSIKNIMSKLKGETARAIQMVNGLNVVMHEQEKTGTLSRESLSSLFNVIDETRKSFVQVRSGAGEIQKVCSSLDDAFRELTRISEQNESSSRKTSDSVVEIKEVTATVSEKAENIRILSEKLGSMVGGYRV